MPDKHELIKKSIELVKKELKEVDPGHDWWHSFRVWNNARKIAVNENVNMTVVELSALLHDICDEKFFHVENPDPSVQIKSFLKKLEIRQPEINHILEIINNISFKNVSHNTCLKTREFKIVQDADRLDAIGAIGIARAFTYGGYKKREMYNPEIQPRYNMSKQDYVKNSGPTINHFYEKLLTLKNLMNTKKGKEMAEERHTFMLKFLDRFYEEWENDIIP